MRPPKYFDYSDSTSGVYGGTLFFKILVHNLMPSVLILASGLLFGIIPTLAIGGKGFVLGVLDRQAVEVAGLNGGTFAQQRYRWAPRKRTPISRQRAVVEEGISIEK